MPGYLGLRGLNPQNPHDRSRERREDARHDVSQQQERRAEEKVQEILREQEGDMSAYNATLAHPDLHDDCRKIDEKPICDIMSTKVAALSFDDNLLTVQGIFSSVRFRHLPVVNEDHEVIGVISDRDFLRVASPFFGTINEQNRDKEIMTRRVGTIMTRKPVCTTGDATVLEAVKLMNAKKISCLPIVKKGTLVLVGIVTWKDVVRAYCPRAFNTQRDSNRLKQGVRVNPETSESARLRSRATKQSTRIMRPVSRPDAEAPQHQSDPAPAHRLRSDTGQHEKPMIAAQDKLPDRSTAGKAGSDLASRQKALIREQVERAKQQQADQENNRI